MSAKDIYSKLLSFYNNVGNKREDHFVLNFLSTLNDKGKTYIEIGAGLGRFLKLVKEKYHFDISAVEINNVLADSIEQIGIETYNINFLDNKFPDNHFDIIHCSHVIEHIPYPEIVSFLDELSRITKPNGFVIIRSPLLSAEFFTSIDHIRPYPPKAILDYFSNPQQQKTSNYSISLVKNKLRRAPYQIAPYSYSSFFRGVNLLFKLSWSICKFPFSAPDGYTAIFQKNINHV